MTTSIKEVSISREDIFKAVRKDCGYRGRQTINDFYWDNAEMVFCNNIPCYGGEHYTVGNFIKSMTRFFSELDGCQNVEYVNGSFIFTKIEVKER